MQLQEPSDMGKVNGFDCLGLVNHSVLSARQESLEQLYQRKVLTGATGIAGDTFKLESNSTAHQLRSAPSANSDTKAKSVYVCHMGTGSRIPSRCLHWRMQVPHIKWYRVCI